MGSTGTTTEIFMFKAVVASVMLTASFISFADVASQSDHPAFTRGKFFSDSVARYQRERVLPDHRPWQHTTPGEESRTKLASKF